MSQNDLSSLFSCLSSLWLFFNAFLSWIVIAIAVLTGLSLYHEFKPGPTDPPTCVEFFIDDELGKLIERDELQIDWGPLWFLGRLKLLNRIPAQTVVRLSCRAAGKLEVTLPDGCYDEKHSRRAKTKTIFLKNPRYFRDTGFDIITAMLETTLGTDYRQRIHPDVVTLGNLSELVISNENREEIRRFQYPVSKEIDPMKLQGTSGIVDGIKFEIPLPQVNDLAGTNLGQLRLLGLPLVLEIRSIPGKRGNDPGTVRIKIGEA